MDSRVEDSFSSGVFSCIFYFMGRPDQKMPSTLRQWLLLLLLLWPIPREIPNRSVREVSTEVSTEVKNTTNRALSAIEHVNQSEVHACSPLSQI